ncbi:MAG: cell wall-binding repeat-containing protein [Actinomycetota bacterium]|nr:cell wall-binding repeat-containing protein [Actinomycetota bacterium]
MSALAYPGGAEEIGKTAQSKVVIVNQSDSAGALAGSVLARANSGSLLLSPSGGLTKALRDEIVRLKPAGAYLIGGQGALSPQVGRDLAAAGVKGKITRLAGATPADTASAVANAVEAGGPQSKFSKGPTVAPGAVIVNPSSSDAGAGAALGAALRYPVLFANSSSLPAATKDALQSSGIHSALVVGTPAEIGANVVKALPSAKRIGDADASATSAAVTRELVARGMPMNVVYVTDLGSAMDGAVIGAAAARLGGVVVVNHGGDATAAAATMRQLHLTAMVDRVVVAHSSTGSSVPWALIGIFVALGLIGIVLLAIQGGRRRQARRPVGRTLE